MYETSTSNHCLAARAPSATASWGPVAKASMLVLQVRTSEVRNLRSPAASLCLAQAQVAGLVIERKRPKIVRKRRDKVRASD